MVTEEPEPHPKKPEVPSDIDPAEVEELMPGGGTKPFANNNNENNNPPGPRPF